MSPAFLARQPHACPGRNAEHDNNGGVVIPDLRQPLSHFSESRRASFQQCFYLCGFGEEADPRSCYDVANLTVLFRLFSESCWAF